MYLRALFISGSKSFYLAYFFFTELFKWMSLLFSKCRVQCIAAEWSGSRGNWALPFRQSGMQSKFCVRACTSCSLWWLPLVILIPILVLSLSFSLSSIQLHPRRHPFGPLEGPLLWQWHWRASCNRWQLARLAVECHALRPPPTDLVPPSLAEP